MRSNKAQKGNKRKLKHLDEYYEDGKQSEFTASAIQNLDEIESKQIYLESIAPPKELPFSNDITQHILSFVLFSDDHHTKLVNKNWNTLCRENEKKIYRSIDESLDTDSPIRYDPNSNKKWLLHPNRGHLTNLELQLGFNGVFNHLSVLAGSKKCNSGDRVYVHDGRYIEPDEFAKNINWLEIRITKDLSVIGVGRNARPSACIDECFRLENRCKLYLQNIEIDCVRQMRKEINPDMIAMACEGGMQLWLKNCTIITRSTGCAVSVTQGSFLCADNCVFENAATGIWLFSSTDSVIIKNSLFKNCGKDQGIESACILIENWPDPVVKLVCDGNTFEDSGCYPIAIINESDMSSTCIKRIWKNNKINGYNAIATNVEAFDGKIFDAYTVVYEYE